MSEKSQGQTRFTRWLREVKERENIRSQRDFAERLGVSPTSVNHWLNGKREPDDTSIAVIARGFGVSRALIYELLARSEPVTLEKYQDWAEFLDSLSDEERGELLALGRAYWQTRGQRRGGLHRLQTVAS